MVAVQPPTSPVLTPDQARILEAFIAAGFDPIATAAAVNLTALALLEWHRHPAVQAALDDLEAFHTRAADLQAAAARRDATRTLHDLLRDTSTPPDERRRVATALLRPARARQTPPSPPKPSSRPPRSDSHSNAACEEAMINDALKSLNSVIDLLGDDPDVSKPRHSTRAPP